MLTATNAIIEEAYAELVRFQRERLVEFAYPHANKAREILRDLIGKEDAEEIDRNIQRERESG